MKDHGYFDAESITWKVGSEAVVMLGGARAVLMQLAHPLVAMGVSEHSRYMQDPIGRAESTFMLGQMLAFGSTRQARHAARTINHLHTHVHGILPMQSGAFSSGTGYNAQDPELLLWVHATLVDTVLLMYALFIRPLSQEEQEQYYQESKRTARLLGLAAAAMPATIDDLRQYINDMVYSNRLAATPQARQLARTVLFPPAPEILRPLMHLNLQITIAVLPQPIREIYGLHWGEHQQHLFDLATATTRVTIPHMPQSLRILPITRKMMQQKATA